MAWGSSLAMNKAESPIKSKTAVKSAVWLVRGKMDKIGRKALQPLPEFLFTNPCFCDKLVRLISFYTACRAKLYFSGAHKEEEEQFCRRTCAL